MRRPTRVAAVLALVLTTATCSGTTTPGKRVSPAGCEQNVQIVVRTGAIPRFSWTPACGMSYVVVHAVTSTPGADGPLMWVFTVHEQSPIGPDIQYGIAPADANVLEPARPLVAGTTYKVRMIQTLGGDVRIGGGEAVFTR
jgi:hypothetical protein